VTNIKQLHQLAEQAINQRDYIKAHGYCVAIIKAQPDHGDAYFLLGIIHIELGQIKKAIELLKKAVSLLANDEYYAYLAKCYSLLGNVAETLAWAKKFSHQNIQQALTLDTLGVALSRVGMHKDALEYFDKALSLQQNNPAYYYNYAVACKFCGDFNAAKTAFEQAIKLRPDYHEAYYALAELGQVDKDHNHIEVLKQLLLETDDAVATLHLGHALAKEYESIGLYGEAFTVLASSKKKKQSKIDYEFSQDQQLFDLAKPHYWQLSCENTGFSSAAPIFVVGMPRSGTTLVERIISSHGDVNSCGELQDFPLAVKEISKTQTNKIMDVATFQAAQTLDFRALGQRYMQRTEAVRGSYKHFVDKLPFNFFYIGLIRRALPNAKIVCLLRNPMDTCIGNYRQLFGYNNPHTNYAYDLMNTARFYQHFYTLAQQWQQAKTDSFYLLNYEKLVAEPEQQIKDLIGFCGLDWQPQCLHAENNTAPVSTASKVQVREPINSRSIGRWKKFKPYTDELEAFFHKQGIAIE
jgi:tetratricopeptide (TPR) repeat protein